MAVDSSRRRESEKEEEKMGVAFDSKSFCVNMKVRTKKKKYILVAVA